MIQSLVYTLLSLPLVAAQKPQYPPAYPLSPELPAPIDYAMQAPRVIPTIFDKTAPNSQDECPGYKASNVVTSTTGLTADLTLAGTPCNSFGFDIQDLSLSVEYQSKERLAVRISPKYIDASNHSYYILDPDLTPYPVVDDGASIKTSDLRFTWRNTPSFSFKVARASDGEVLFDTTGNVLVFQDQFLELVTAMVPDYNIYGLGESLQSFRLPQGWTQTFWASYNVENDNVIGKNTHSTHPVYLETRYHKGGSTSHGVYARNAHGQDWLLRDDHITYRTIGGSFDFYFLSGDTPKEVISQYHTQIIGTPYLQPYWTLGFMQLRWGYLNWTNLRDVLDLYKEQNIQVEMIATDLDPYFLNRMFTDKPIAYPFDEGKVFLEELHAAGQYYFPLLNPAIYVPDPTNASDVYPPYNRGEALDVYVRAGDTNVPYYGVLWAGIQAYVDFLAAKAQEYWTGEIVRYHDRLDFDGYWLDVNDASSYVSGPFPPTALKANPVHLPFPLPGDPQTSQAVNYVYPEGFGVTNATEARIAARLLASQSRAYPPPPTPTPTITYHRPVHGRREVNFPPYAIKNDAVPGNSLVKHVLSPDAKHNDELSTQEYDIHNLYGHTSCKATYNALKAARPGLRPFTLCRSPFAGTGSFAGHWGGDSNSAWGNMYFTIGQALNNALAGIAYFGVETCGFNGNSDLELCTRWMQLSAWFPLYRNHNNRNTIAQEAYRWATTAEATRRIMHIRYSLLPYTYTLFYRANTFGETVLRALPWEFPNEPILKDVETQFMSGPALLITPVLGVNAKSVQGVFPGVATGTIWYNFYTLEKVNVAAGMNKTLEAPLVYQPIHLRGGNIVPIQLAGNTTATSRKMPWSLLIGLDAAGEAEGSLYLDDGVSIVQKATKYIDLSFANNVFKATVTGSFEDGLPLANITIAGIQQIPDSVSVTIDGKSYDTSGVHFLYDAKAKALLVSGLESATSGGVWSGDAQIKLIGTAAPSSYQSWGGNWGCGWGLPDI